MSPHSNQFGTKMRPKISDSNNDLALLAQIRRLQEELGISDEFFAHLLGIQVDEFVQWKAVDHKLSRGQTERLEKLTEVMSHIRSFLGYDLDRVRTMLEYVSDNKVATASLPFTPPWIGTSLKEYLENNGARGLERVNYWIQSLTFANSF
jgi:DNA-binding transcriptional regulator YiaG